VDYDTVEANTVTLRERDSMAQVRPKAAKQNELVYVTCTKALHGAFPSHDGELYACFVLGALVRMNVPLCPHHLPFCLPVGTCANR
jgi:hypothetical protein